MGLLQVSRARTCGRAAHRVSARDPRHRAGGCSPNTQVRRTGGAAERGCTLCQISRFKRTSSARSATAKSPGGIGERYAWGFISSRDHVFDRTANGVESGRLAKAVHTGVAAETYWLSGGKPDSAPIHRTTELVV